MIFSKIPLSPGSQSTAGFQLAIISSDAWWGNFLKERNSEAKSSVSGKKAGSSVTQEEERLRDLGSLKCSSHHLDVFRREEGCSRRPAVTKR